MSITPEQAMAVGKILHPNWTFTEKFTGPLIGGKRVMTVHYMHPGAPRGAPRFYNPLTNSECWAMVEYVVEMDRYGNEITDAFACEDHKQGLVDLVLAIGGGG